jgi:hypothetical protein
VKARHAAALALVGWYLMIPPIEGTAVNRAALLSKWNNKGSFDNASTCTTELQVSQDQARKSYEHPEIEKQPKGWNMPPDVWRLWVKTTSTQFLAAICIASDDPRLKSN